MIKKIMKILCVMCVSLSSFASLNMTIEAANTPEPITKKGRAASNVITIPAGTNRGQIEIKEDTTLIFEGDATIESVGSGIYVHDGKNLNIEIKNNGNVYVAGSDAVGYPQYGTSGEAMAAYPGINIRKGSRLYVYGKGTLNARGGNGFSKQEGRAGGKAARGVTSLGDPPIQVLGQDAGAEGLYKSTDITSHWIYKYPIIGGAVYESFNVAGDSGFGGHGGFAPAPGIGGKAGLGGKGMRPGNANGTGLLNVYSYGPVLPTGSTSPNGYEGIAGWNGGNGEDGQSCGDVYAHGEVTISAMAGNLVTSKNNSVKPGGTATDNGNKTNISGGGAGGNGGEAYGSPGIGGSGGAGGAGGDGGTGGMGISGEFYKRRISGGGGGGGGAGSTPGVGGAAGVSWNVDSRDGNAGGTVYGGNGGDNTLANGEFVYHYGGNGGTGGKAGSNGQGGKIYTDPIATVNSYDSLSAAGGGGKSLVANASVNFIDDFDVTLSQNTYTYDGAAKRPRVLIKRKSDQSDCTSIEGTNYAVEYKDNTDAGTATVTLTSLGDINQEANYLEMGSTGKMTMTFTIAKANNPVTISTNYDVTKTIDYGGEIQATLVSRHVKNTGAVTWSMHSDSTAQAKFVKTNDDSYKIIPTKIGKLKLSVSIASSNNFYASSAQSVVIDVTPYDIKKGTEVVIPNPGEQKYTGVNIEPEHGKNGLANITYTNNKDSEHTTLIEGTDFTYEYGSDNLNAGTIGTMTVKATGNYTGEQVLTFPIIPRPIEETTITVNDIMFTGTENRPEPVVKIGSTVIPYLTTNGDFTLLWKDKDGGTDLTLAGDKKVVVEGTGNISGRKEVEYKVKPANIADVVEEEAAKDVYFDGDAKKQESRAKYSYFNIALTEKDSGQGTVNDPDDYELIFTNNEHAGTATVTVNGINNFAGSSRTYTYEVMKRPLYIIPDKNQWKYLGTVDTFGSEQTQKHPTYKQYIKKLIEGGSKEENENNGEFIVGHEPSLEGNLSRELGETLGNHKYTIGTLQLGDDTSGANINRDYEISLVDTTNYFNIKELDPIGLKTTLNGVKGKDEWYKNEKVKVEAPEGFTISRSNSLGADNPWAAYVTYEDGEYISSPVSFYLKRNSDNAITSIMTQAYKQDATKPEGMLQLNEDIWDKMQENPFYEYFVNSDKTGEISGKDKLSGMDKYHWYLSDKKLTMEELDAIEMPSEDQTDKKVWKKGTQFKLSIDELNQTRGVVYGRLEDKAGNVFYMGSDGIVFDKDKPLLSAEYKEDNTWTKDANVKITGNIVDSNAGLKERYVAYEIPGEPVHMLTVGSDGEFTIDKLKDGEYDLTISAWDNANNQADPVTFHVKKDTQVPRLIVSGNTTGILAKEEIVFNNEIGASGVKKLEVKFNDGQWQEIEDKFDQKIYADKNGKYTFRVTNGLDVVSEEASITFTRIDNKEPILKIDSYNGEEIIEANNDGEILNKDAISVVLRNMENNKGEMTFSYKKEGEADFTVLKKSYDTMARVPLIQDEGTHSYTFKVEAGNGLVKQQTVTYKIDKTAPIGVIDFEKDTSRSILNTLALGAFYNEDQKVTITAQDVEKNGFASGISKVEHFVYGGTSAKISAAPHGDEVEAIEYLVKKQGEWATGETTFIRDDQAYVVYYKVSDKVGNTGYVRSDEVMMDRVAPIIEINYDHKDQEWDDEIEIPVSIHDTNPGLDKASYIVKNQDEVTVKENLNANANFMIDGLPDGIYTIEIHAVDKSGNESVEKLEIKQDGGKPTITATADASSFNNVTMDVEIDAEYTGPSGLGKIMMSKNGESFEDITSQILDGKYAVNENGDYIFRAYTKAGGYQDVQVRVDQFTALNVTAKVKATTQEGDIYESDTWTNQDVHLEFSNTVANLQGLKHYIKDESHSDWTQVNTANGKIVYDFDSAGSYEVSYKVSLADGSKESAPVDFKVNIDTLAPTAKIKISDVEWNNVWSALTLGAYFNKKEVAKIIGDDPQPHASEIKSIQYYYDETKNLPDTLEGNTDASKIETAVKDNWVTGDQVVLSPNASYVVFGKVEDNAGNVTYVSSDGVVFDDFNPTIVSDVDEVNWYTDIRKSLNFDVDDNLSSVDQAIYTINDGASKQATLSYGKFNISLNELQEGQNKVVLRVSDKSKNITEIPYTVKVDTTVPTLNLRDTSTTSDLVLSRLIEVTPTVGASGVAKVEVKTPIDNEWKDITSSYEDGYIANENGIYVFRVTNKAGISSAFTSIEVGNITSERPLIEWDFETSTSTRSGYVEGTWTNKDVSVAFTNRAAGQTIRSYEYNIDNGPWQSISVNRDHVARFSAIEGKHTYGMRLINEIGIESESKYTEIRIDTVKPNVSITDDGQVWNNQSTMLQVEASDDLSGLSDQAYSYDGGNTWVEDENLAQYVNRTTNIWVKDKAGNITSNTYQIENIDTKAPIMKEFKQEDEAEAKTRNIEVALADYKDDYGNEGSGVDKAYVTTLYPYENGELVDESKWIELTKEVDEDTYKNEAPIRALKKGKNPVYLVLVDVVGNTNVVEAEITNMLSDSKEEPQTKPESKVEKKEVVVNHYIDVVKEIDKEELLTKIEISEKETRKIKKEINYATKEMKKLNKNLSDYANEKEVEQQKKDVVKMIGIVVLLLAILGAIAYMYHFHRLKKKAKGEQAYE